MKVRNTNMDIMSKTGTSHVGAIPKAQKAQSFYTEAKRCFATHDEDESWLDECRKIVYIQSHAYIFNSSTLFNNVPMAQWSTLMPCNREVAGSNL